MQLRLVATKIPRTTVLVVHRMEIPGIPRSPRSLLSMLMVEVHPRNCFLLPRVSFIKPSKSWINRLLARFLLWLTATLKAPCSWKWVTSNGLPMTTWTTCSRPPLNTNPLSTSSLISASSVKSPKEFISGKLFKLMRLFIQIRLTLTIYEIGSKTQCDEERRWPISSAIPSAALSGHSKSTSMTWESWL